MTLHTPYDAEGGTVLLCPSCGWGLAGADGYCHNCEPPVEDYGYELECTHCGGEGTCADGSDPLDTCPDHVHRCHACNGTGADTFTLRQVDRLRLTTRPDGTVYTPPSKMHEARDHEYPLEPSRV